MELTSLEKFGKIYPIALKKYELFNPSGDDTDVIGKVNSIIDHLNKVNKLSSEVVVNWNKVMQWVLEEGLTDGVKTKVDEMIASGLFDEIINTVLDGMNTEVTTKLDGFEASLLEKATKTELSNVLDGSPKGTYTTLTALQTAFPTGTTGVYIVTADGHIYSWGGSAWVDRGLYQAQGIGDGTITKSKLDTGLQSKILTFQQLVNDVYMRNGIDTVTVVAVDTTTKEYTTNTTYGSFGFTVPNTNGNKYKVVTTITNIGSASASNVKRMVTYNNSPNLTSGVSLNGIQTGETVSSLAVGASLTFEDEITSTESVYTGIALSVLTSTNGAKFRVKQKVYDVTSLDVDIKDDVDWLNVPTYFFIGDRATVAKNAENVFSRRKNTTWSNYGDSISWAYNWHTIVNNEIGFTEFIRNGKPGAKVTWSTNMFYIDANGIYDSVATSGTQVHEAFCAYDRISNTIDNTLPLIFCMGGTNDFLSNIPLGDTTFNSSNVMDVSWNAVNPVGDYNITTFKGSIASTIMKIQHHAPNALIIFGTLFNGIGATTGVNQYQEETNTLGLKPSDYAKAWKEVCEQFGVPCIDVFGKCGVNIANRATYISDTVHPNSEGDKMLARVVIDGFNEHIPRI
jgi:lysophospholipase L1-like esterase